MIFKDGKGKGKEVPKFEVNFIVRDKSGKPTSKRKTFASDSAKDMSAFFNKHTHITKGKGAKGKKGKRPSSGGANS